MKYVITGGPCVGKSTTLGVLESRGFSVVPEAARDVIARESKREGGILPWTDFCGFQQLVLVLQLEREKDAPAGAFCDRGVLDGRAYCRINGVALPRELAEVEHGYARVFLLSPLERFVSDAERYEKDPALARRLHDELASVYYEAGYDLVQVPLLSPDERASFILAQLRIG